MSLYQPKKSPFWHFDFRIRGYRFSGSTECESKRDAAKIETAEKVNARELIKAIFDSGRSPMTIEAACARWWNEHGQHLNDPDLKARLDWIVAEISPRTALHAITNDTVSKLVETRRLDVRRSGLDDKGKQLYRPITARTVNKTTVSLLRRVMRRARDNWDAVILREPVWKKHTLPEKRRPIRELMPSEELILDTVEDQDFSDVRRFAIITGLRRRNVLLKKTQVNFEAGTVAIIGKGGIPKILPLSAEAYAILWRRQNHPTEYVFTFAAERTRKCPKTGRQFIKGERHPITYYGLGSNKRKWAGAGVVARIHDLRHTTGMRTLRATGNLKVTSELLGHSTIAITAKFYTDATLGDLRVAMETTAEALRRDQAQLLLPQKKEGEQ